jgi:D-alanyl-D-alanine carboxypeptidase (penicillin-binding protein 5/6)
VQLARRLFITFCVLTLAFPFASAQEPSPKKSARAKHAADASTASDSAETDDGTPVRKAKRVSKTDEESDGDSTPSKPKRVRKAKRVRPTGVPDRNEEQAAPAATAMPVAGSAPRVPPNTRAQAVMVVDARTGEILYEKNADSPRAAASTQKLLTALIVAEQGYLDQPVTVQPVDTLAEPVKLNIRPGETYQRIDLLRALLVKSPNDVARCLARDNAGSIEAFAEKMNAKARQLGATHSFFLNPNGLPIPGQYSTARDLAMIARAAYANPTIRSIVCLPQLVFRYANGRTRELENTNKVLRRLPFCNGMKTGYTEAAGHCLIASGARPGRDVIAVVLGDSKGGVWQDASALLTWGLSI